MMNGQQRAVTGQIFDITHYMLEDGPGIRTNVFLKGCPLRCRWCSNAYGLKRGVQLAYRENKCIGCGRCEMVCAHGAIRRDGASGHYVTDFMKCKGCTDCVKACPADARLRIGTEITIAEVIREIEKDRNIYRRSGGGVTLSGGEILMQPVFAHGILKECRNRMIDTAIETSAFGKWEDLERILAESNTAFIDCKCMDPVRHRELTGADNGIILNNIQKAASYCDGHDVRMVVRFPLIPTLNDDEENLLATAEFVRGLSGTPLLNILPYHNYGTMKYDQIGETYGLQEIKPPDRAALEHLSFILDRAGVRYRIGGYNI